MEMSEGPPTAARSQARDLLRSGEVEALLFGIAAGRQPALAEFYDRCSRQVFALSLRIVRDRQLAEEVLLDVFLQVWRRAKDYDPERGRGFHWLLTIARSRALDTLRSKRLRGQRETALGQAHERPDRGAQPLERLDTQERAQRVQQAVADLPLDQSRALELAYFQNLSHAEVAARLGLPLGTIKTRIRLGMLKLRDKLKTYEDER
jgi:RNA polymerase sigma-70 factor (ECF subfamily)